MSYNIGSLAMDLNVDISSARSSAQRVSNIYRQVMTNVAKMPIKALQEGAKVIRSGWKDAMREASEAGTATLRDGLKGAAKGLAGGLSSAAMSFGKSILNVTSQLMIAAAELKFSVGQSVLGGYANTIMEGVNNYGQESRSLDLAELVIQIAEGNKEYGDRMEAYTARLDKMNKNITEIATELSYDRVTIARLIEGLAKTGVSEDELLGGNTRASRQNSLASQTALLAEAMNLPAGQIDEAVKLMTLGRAAFGELSNEQIANTMVGIYANTAQEPERIKYGLQDALPAGKAAGVSLPDIAQLVTQLAKLSSFEVAGTLGKTLLQSIATPERLNRGYDNIINEYYNPEGSRTRGEGKFNSFVSAAREEGNLVESIKDLYGTFELAYKDGKMGSLGGYDNEESAGAYFNTLDSAEQKQLIEQAMSSYFGGGDTTVQAVRALMASSKDDDSRLKNSLENFYGGSLETLDGDAPLEAFKKVKQEGFAGAVDLVGSSIDNVKKSIGEELEPSMVGLVHLFKDVANNLNDGSDTWLGGLERINNKLMEAFSDEDLIEGVTVGIENVIKAINYRAEGLTDELVKFLSDSDNIDNAFDSVTSAVNDMITGFMGLSRVMMAFMPLVDKLTEAMTATIGVRFAKGESKEQARADFFNGVDGNYDITDRTGVISGDNGLFNKQLETIYDYEDNTRALTEEEKVKYSNFLNSTKESGVFGRELGIQTGGAEILGINRSVEDAKESKDPEAVRVANQYVEDSKPQSEERKKFTEQALSNIEVLTLEIDGEMQEFLVGARGVEGGNNLFKETDSGFEKVNFKEDRTLIKKMNDAISELNKGRTPESDAAVQAQEATSTQKRDRGTADNTVAGFGRYASSEDQSKILNLYNTFKKNEDGSFVEDAEGNKVRNMSYEQATTEMIKASNAQITKVFGDGNAFYNPKTGDIDIQDTTKLDPKGISENPYLFNNLVDAMTSGTKFSDFLVKEGKEGGRLEDTTVSTLSKLIEGRVKDAEGNRKNVVLTREELKDIAVKSGTGEGSEEAAVLEAIQTSETSFSARLDGIIELAKENTKADAFGNKDLTGEIEKSINLLKSEEKGGNLVGAINPAISDYLKDLKSDIQNTDLSDKERVEKQMAYDQFAKAFKLTKDIDFSEGQNTGIATEMVEVQKAISQLTSQQLKAEQEIVNLRQRGLELQKENLIETSAVMGKLNAGASEVLGIVNQFDRAVIQANSQIANLDDNTRRDREQAKTKYGKITGATEEYNGSFITVPTANFGEEGENFLTLQKQIIDNDAIKRQEINNNLERQQESFVAKLNNVAERMYESIAEGLRSVVNNTLTVQSGDGTAFASQTNRLYSGVEESVVNLSQNLQTLKTLELSAPGSVDSNNIELIEASLESIPEYFKQTMDEVYDAFIQKLDDYTFSLIEREQSRQVSNLQNTGAGTESFKMLLGLQNVEISNTRQLRENQKTEAQLSNELSGLRRQLSNIRTTQAFQPGRIGLGVRESVTQSAIRVVEAQKDINTLKTDADALQADKERLRVISDSGEALIRDIMNTKNAFGNITTEAVTFENTLTEVRRRTSEWSNTAKEVMDAYNAGFADSGAMDFTGFEDYIAKMKEIAKEVEDIALVRALRNITERIEDYQSELEGVMRDGRQQDRSNEISLIRSETSGESYRADIRIAQLQAETIEEQANSALGSNARDARRKLTLNEERRRQALADYEANPTTDEKAINLRMLELQSINEERATIINSEKEKARQIKNDRNTQLELLKDEATMTGRISKEIANIVSSGFGDLYDTLTDRTQSWGDKFKSLGDNLMKQLGRVGWEMIFGGIKDMIIGALTKKARAREEQERIDFVSGVTTEQVTGSGFNVNTLTVQEMMKKYMEQSTGFIENSEAIRQSVAGDLRFDNEAIANATEVQFNQLLSSKDFEGLDFSSTIADNADMGIKGVARNTTLMAEMFKQQLIKQDALIGAVKNIEVLDKDSIKERVDSPTNSEDSSPQGTARDVKPSSTQTPKKEKSFESVDSSGQTHYWYDGRYHKFPKGQKPSVSPTQSNTVKTTPILKPTEVTLPEVKDKPLEGSPTDVQMPVEEPKNSRRQIGLNEGDIIDLGNTEAGRRYNNVGGNNPEAIILNENTTGRKKKEDGYYGRMPVSNLNIEGAPSSIKDNIDAINSGKKINPSIQMDGSSPSSIQDNIDYLMNQQAFAQKGNLVASNDLSGLGIANEKVNVEMQKKSLDKMDTAEKILQQIAENTSEKLDTQISQAENDPIVAKAKETVDLVTGQVKEESTTPVSVTAKPDTNPAEKLQSEKGADLAKDGIKLAQQAGVLPAAATGGGIGANVSNTLSSALMSSGNPFTMAAGVTLPLLYGLFKGKEKPKRYNKGVSAVPGNGSTDSVPALLTPGEAVLTRGAVERLGGRDFIEAANFGRMGFLHKNTGGMIDKGHALLLNKGGIVKPTSLGMKKMEKPLRSSHTALEAAKYNQMTDNQRSIENFANSADGGDAAMTGRKLQEDNTLKIEYSAKSIAGVNYVTEDTFQKGMEASIARAQQQMYKGLRNSTRTRKQLGI